MLRCQLASRKFATNANKEPLTGPVNLQTSEPMENVAYQFDPVIDPVVRPLIHPIIRPSLQ